MAPTKGKMFKGLLVCYSVVISTFFSVGISGYWAFGNQSLGSILQNFMVNGKPLVNKWFLLMTNVFTFVQVIAVVLVSLLLHNLKKKNCSFGGVSLLNAPLDCKNW